MAELGYPGFEANTWFAVFASAHTPSAVLNQLNAEINRAVAAKPVLERFQALSLEAQTLDRPTLRHYIETELAKWGRLVKDIGITVQ